MQTLHIIVSNKIATYQRRDGDIVCGNSDYQIAFTFDDEWAEHAEKTARFIWNGQYFDVDFTGDTCPVPIVTNTNQLTVGVYAGQLSTTTPATIGCKKSILCGGEPPSPGTGENYSNEAKAAAEEAKAAAEEAKEAAEEAKEAAARAEAIVGDVGDIHSALDTIIAEQEAIIEIQENLMGVSKFYLSDGTRWYFEESMLWADFISSKYNVDKVFGTADGGTVSYTKDGKGYVVVSNIAWSTDAPRANRTYELTLWEG